MQCVCTQSNVHYGLYHISRDVFVLYVRLCTDVVDEATRRGRRVCHSATSFLVFVGVCFAIKSFGKVQQLLAEKVNFSHYGSTVELGDACTTESLLVRLDLRTRAAQKRLKKQYKLGACARAAQWEDWRGAARGVASVACREKSDNCAD